MNDNALFALTRGIIVQGLADYLSIEVDVLSDYQPTQQGSTLNAAVYMHLISDNRYGYPKKKSQLIDNVMTHTETSQMETTYQVNARVIRNASSTTQLTANDVLNTVAAILQSDIAINAFLAQNVGIYRIQPLRQTYIQNEFDRNEVSPSFDFTLTHERSIVRTVPSFTTFNAGIYPI